MRWFMIPAGAAGGWSGQGCDPAEIQRLNRATWSRGLVPRPGPVAGHAALAKLMEDRVLVSEHIAMRSEAGHLQHRGLVLVTKQRVTKSGQMSRSNPDTTHPPATGAQAAARCWPGRFHCGPGNYDVIPVPGSPPAGPWHHEGR